MEKSETFFCVGGGGGGGKEHGSGPLALLALKVTIGVKGYQNSVQPPL